MIEVIRASIRPLYEVRLKAPPLPRPLLIVLISGLLHPKADSNNDIFQPQWNQCFLCFLYFSTTDAEKTGTSLSVGINKPPRFPLCPYCDYTYYCELKKIMLLHCLCSGCTDLALPFISFLLLDFGSRRSFALVVRSDGRHVVRFPLLILKHNFITMAGWFSS